LQLLVQFVCGVTILVVFIIPGRCWRELWENWDL